MGRNADALDGLAILGRAQIGALTVPVPALAVPEGTSSPPASASATIAALPSPESGVRAYRIAFPEGALDLRFDIPTPDLTSTPAPVRIVGPVAYVHGPLDTAAAEPLRAVGIDLIVLSNSRELFLEGAPFVETIGAIRLAAGGRPVLWAPRVALPHRVPMLVYLGVDLLDATETLVVATEGRALDVDLGETAKGPLGFCDCVPGGTHSAPAELRAHGLYLLGREFARARSAARAHRLRELVEARLSSEPLLAELLRYADQLLGDLLDEREPVTSTGPRTYVLKESFRRPEVARYRRRFLERYRPPPSKQILLLVPCSKTKPYRNSRSHRRFATAWQDLRGAERIHVVSVTSPLGLVPRELEDLPPCRHYDIPVTGTWDEDERSAVRNALQHLLRTGPYSTVIVHLDPSEYGFLRDLVAPTEARPATWTVSEGRATSSGSLAALASALEAGLEGALSSARGILPVVKEELAAIAAMQFGREPAEALFRDPIRLQGRPWFQKINDGEGRVLATWQESRGLFHLTASSLARITKDPSIAVTIGDDFELSGDAFAPGVRGASEGIRIGDSVVVASPKRGGFAVGEAALPGRLMPNLGRGIAVRMRHKSSPKGEETDE